MADRQFDSDAERKAYLAGVEDTAKKLQGEPLTLAQVRRMSKDEVKARMPEVHEAMRRGPQENEGNDDDTD